MENNYEGYFFSYYGLIFTIKGEAAKRERPSFM
jgi:hypothetical protein